MSGAGKSSEASVDTDVAPDLAIVIPAYRARYLDEALGSIAAQQARGFIVHVGDDASPEDLAAVCRRWEDKLPLRYRRFEQNVGARDLVAQWERCIALSDAPWIWLFSDDDVMEPGCVGAWRAAATANPRAVLFHFNVVRIDADSRPILDEPAFPPRLTPRQFLLERLFFRLSSYAPDYVFSRKAYQAVNGIEPFPLAWGSDDATWIKLAAQGEGIHTVAGARMHWRLSGTNISSRGGSAARAAEKLEACVQYLEWLDGLLPTLPREAGDPDDLTLQLAARRWLYRQAEFVDGRFRKLGLLRLALRLGRLRGHAVTGSMLRMIQADWRNRKPRPA